MPEGVCAGVGTQTTKRIAPVSSSVGCVCGGGTTGCVSRMGVKVVANR
jgi:hypothetical protein